MNKILDYIDTLFDKSNQFLDTTLPQIADIHIGKYITIKRKTQLISMFTTGFMTVVILVRNIGTVFAHGGHGDEEAANLGAGTGGVFVGAQFISPIELESSSLENQSYPGSIMSDEYGSIFSSRQGIVSKFYVNLGDKVKKGQTVATISLASNTPEVIIMLAQANASIIVAQGQIDGYRKVVDYLNAQSGTVIKDVFTQKRNAIDISIDTQQQQLQAKIDYLAVKNNPKLQTIETKLQGSIQHAVATLGKVFAKGETTYQSFTQQFGRNNYWGAKDTSQKQIFDTLMVQVFSKYKNLATLSGSEIFELAKITEDAVKQGVKLLGVSISAADYPLVQLTEDIESLIDAYADPDIGITTIISTHKEILFEIEQETNALSRELKLLDAEKSKELADLGGNQSEKGFDMQKMIIDAETNAIIAQAELQANKNALSAIIGATKSITVTAPFAGTISRKNVVIGQSIEPTTPLFDIVGGSTSKDVFVRFEVPIVDYKKTKIGQILSISLPGSDITSKGQVIRIAQSVNQDKQTVTVEGRLGNDDVDTYPIGTSIRVSTQGFSGTTVLQIPSAALGQDEDGKLWVYKVLESKKLKKRYVEHAYTDKEQSFLNSGLKPTDIIVSQIAGGNRSDGQDVSSLIEDTK